MSYNPKDYRDDGRTARRLGYGLERNPYDVPAPVPRGFVDRGADWAAGWKAEDAEIMTPEEERLYLAGVRPFYVSHG